MWSQCWVTLLLLLKFSSQRENLVSSRQGFLSEMYYFAVFFNWISYYKTYATIQYLNLYYVESVITEIRRFKLIIIIKINQMDPHCWAILSTLILIKYLLIWRNMSIECKNYFKEKAKGQHKKAWYLNKWVIASLNDSTSTSRISRNWVRTSN